MAAIAREVEGVLAESGYKVLVQDYDMPFGANFVGAMHEAIKNSRDLVVLFTQDYEESPYTRKEFTSFEAERLQSREERQIIILRCEDAPLRGLLADNIWQDLVGVDDFQERRRRIIAAVDGQSQEQRPPPRPFVGVPPRIAGFTGRVDELDRLDAILVSDKPAAVVQATRRAAVYGLGGIGKTSLAIEYANRFRDLYAGVWWCPAETRTGLLTSLAGLASTLGAAPPGETDIEKLSKAALRKLAEQRAIWLLIYDNVSSPEDVAELLPAQGARVLITSRYPDWNEWAVEVELDVLPMEEAVMFLQSRAGRRDRPGAETLAEELGQLPLALDHAGAFCKLTGTSFQHYTERVQDLMTKVPKGVMYSRSVAATISLAIERAAADCPAAVRLLGFFSLLGPDRIPLDLVDNTIVDSSDREAALMALTSVSLIKQNPFPDGTAAVTVHRLVQAETRARIAF